MAMQAVFDTVELTRGPVQASARISETNKAKWQAWLDSEPQEWKDLYDHIDRLPPRSVPRP